MTTPKRRRWPRWAWLASLCAVLGLMTSVGVAWGLVFHAAASTPMPWNRMPIQGSVFQFYSVNGFREIFRWSLRRSEWVGVDSNDLSLESAGCLVNIDNEELFPMLTSDPVTQQAISRHTPLLITPQGTGVEFSVMFAGWPKRCLAGEDAYSKGDHLAFRARKAARLKSNPEFSDLIKPVLDEPATRFDLNDCYDAMVLGGVLCPLRPLWPGLLADTGLFAGAWAALIFTPLGVRHWLRARRGGCPHCGYSREGLKEGAACPECGRGA